MLKNAKWLLAAVGGIMIPQVFAQLAPSGEHYAGRPSDTGYGGTFANATGTFATAVSLELPPARGGLPIPLQIAYGGGGVGAAGLGWDVPLSYIQRDQTMAHRRPASAPGALPEPRDRAYVSLLGQSVELISQGGDWVARSGTLELTVRESGGAWLAYDGNGRTYTFTRPANLGATGLWLLDSITGAGGASVSLTYQISTPAIDGGSGIAIDLLGISYNSNPAQGATCAKNEIALTYGNQSATPLSISVLGDQVLVRKQLLTLVDVRSRATCATRLQSLRRYDFQYEPDTDTLLPRLGAVRMFGRQDTPEASVALPVANYSYGAVTQGGKLTYQVTQTIVLPSGAATNQISGTALDGSVNAPVAGERYAMWQTLIDVTGDGRPDLVFKKNDKLWIAYNAPGLNGQTTLGAGNQGIVQLSDATFANGAFSTQTSVHKRFAYAPANRNTTEIWRQAIDVNGDGRIDIIDAAEEPGHWVIYLNTPGGPTGVQWQRRSFSIETIRETLVSNGHVIDGDYVPLSRRATGADGKMWQCWRWNGTQWNWYPDGFFNHRCLGVENELTAHGPEQTYIEWELNDLNGDGYPDFVFNSSPVDFQLNPPNVVTHIGGAVFPTDFGVSGPLPVQFSPRSTNRIRAMFNVLGVRFYTDDNPFSQSVDLIASEPELGVGMWGCPGYRPGSSAACDDSFQSQSVGFSDVNGDGLVDRVVGNKAYLGAYARTAFSFSPVYVTLPGPLATEHNTNKTECSSTGNQKPTADQTQGLRDLTGDGIPDYYDNRQIWIGTGTGFRAPIPLDTASEHFFSHQTESCSGDISNTDGGLFDIDGDGKPEIIGLSGNSLVVSQLAGGQSPGSPEGGRLTEIDNGYGARTDIGYVAAKRFTDNPLPFPEIVVSSVATTGTQNLGGTLAGSRYAYSNGEMLFDSELDRYLFSGYERVVEVRLLGVLTDVTTPAGALKDVGAATITDTWPLAPFTPGLTKQDRWLRKQLVGRTRDIFTLRGVADPNPWSLLNVDASDPRVIGVAHTEWDAKLYELPPNPNESIVDCLEMTVPLDLELTLASSGANSLDVCRSHGFAFAVSGNTWYGGAPPPSDNNIQTRWQALSVDDFDRPILTQYDNDVFRSDDDICVANTFASPSGTFPRVLNALASERVYPCGKGDDATITLAGESWEYDGLPAGQVADGRLTSHNVDRHETVAGTLLNTIHRFDATYDPSGNLAAVRTQRDGAARTVTFSYDPFGLVQTRTSIDATGLPSTASVTSYDSISLQPLSSTDVNQTTRGIDFDGFGRPVRVTVTPAGGSLGVMSVVNYLGFTGLDPAGRRVAAESFTDPVPPSNLQTATGRSGTVLFDELGRSRRTELALGSDYANEVMVVGSRSFDGAGRVMFEADPYPKSQNAATAYGTSYFFKDTGDLDCVIRGAGQQTLSMATNLAAERFPTCFQRSFAGHVETDDVRDAASLQAGSPQAGVVSRVVATAIGRIIERSSWSGGIRIEDASFSYDRLGQQTSMIRFLHPVMPANPVHWSMQLDSLGQTLQLTEPNTATRTYRYSDWGEQIETQWTDGAIDRRLEQQYDALGRLSGSEERNDGATDAETVNTYTYDVGVNVSPLVSPAFVLGQLARASSPSGEVTFSYDAFGRVNAQVFNDNQGGVYIQKTGLHANGSLGSLQFNLPDQNYSPETVKYTYDSADTLRGIQYSDASGSRELYHAQVIDPFGRVLKAVLGGNIAYASAYAETGRRLQKETRIDSPLGSRRLMFGSFDPNGRELSRRETANGAVTGSRTDLSYDALGRLSSAVKVDGGGTAFNWQYAYDPLGNLLNLHDLLGASGAALSYRSDDRDKVCRIGYGPGGLGGTACNVEHDGSGNTIRQVTRTGLRNFSYFDSGNVRDIVQGAARATFRYDAFGGVQELNVTGTGVSDERHDRRYGELIERRDQVINGATTTFLSRNIPGPGGIIASRRGTKQDWVFQFGEARGNRFFVDGTGAFAQSVDYQPFGEANSSGALPGSTDYTTFQWNGGDALAAFGLSHLGARLYDPVIGRFLSRDPWLAPGTATTTNPYSFAQNDPVNASDPSGLDCLGEGCQPDVPITPMGPFMKSVIGSAVKGGGAATIPPPPASDRLAQAIYNEERYQADQARTCAQDPDSNFCDTKPSIAFDPTHPTLTGVLRESLRAVFLWPVSVPTYYVKTEVSVAEMQRAQTGVDYFAARDRYMAARASIAASRFAEDVARFATVGMMLSHALLQLGSNTIRVGTGPTVTSAPPLAHVLEGFPAGQGFSGAWDESTNETTMLPSTDTREAKVPKGWVSRGMGHGRVSANLGGDQANHFGYAVQLQENGSLKVVSWKSGTLNPGDGFVPPGLRPMIMKAIEAATGRKVFE